MRQAIPIAFTLVLLGLAPAGLHAGDEGAGPLKDARALVRTGDYARAATILEDAVVEASPANRAAMIELLRESYRALITRAEAAGKSQEAATYRDNLAILEPEPAKPDPTTAGANQSRPKASPAPAAVVARNDSTAKKTEPKQPPRAPIDLDRILSQAPSALPDPGSLPPPTAERPQKAADAPGPADPAPSLPLTSPKAPAGKPDAAATGDAAVERASAPAAAAPAPALQPTVSEVERTKADQLFTQKKYEDAGRIYAGLAARNQLPAQRKAVWAYCRWVAVVARINAHPRSDREWDDIEQEIHSIQRLTPGNWYGEYLLNRVAEARRGGKPPSRNGRLVVRGSDPDETPPRGSRGLLGRLRSGSQPAPGVSSQAAGEQALGLPSAAAGDDPPRVGKAAASTGARNGTTGAARTEKDAPESALAWLVRETRNFRIYYIDPALGEKAAEAAEAVRSHQAKRWGSSAARVPWSPRCDIYLYPSADDFAKQTGQPESSPGFSTMGINANRVISRRVNLRGDHPQLLTAVLPHEVTHVVLADLFTEQQIPRWADEGIAVLAEPKSEQLSRAAELTGPLKDGKVFKLSELMAIDYPNEESWNLYYAQSVSLTQFLVSEGTPAQFIAFVRGAQQKGVDSALREVYHMEGSAALETKWQNFARRQASEVTASSRDAASETDPVRRQ
jgi:hypothetical protein